MIELLFLSLIGGLFSLIGAFVLLWRGTDAKKVMTPLLAFAAGAFLAAAMLDILPEAIEMVAEPHLVFAAALVGFVSFFTLERGLMRFGRHHHDEPHRHGDHTESLSFLVILGDSIHNFLDGVIIGVAYLINPAVGVATTLGVAAHEIPQEIGDATILLNQGWRRRKILMANIFQSLLSVPGALIGFYAGGLVQGWLPYLLGITGGVFLYLAASDLIPEIHHHAGHKDFGRVVVPMIASILLVWWLASLTHG